MEKRRPVLVGIVLTAVGWTFTGCFGITALVLGILTAVGAGPLGLSPQDFIALPILTAVFTPATLGFLFMAIVGMKKLTYFSRLRRLRMGIRAGALRRCYGRWFCCRCRRDDLPRSTCRVRRPRPRPLLWHPQPLQTTTSPPLPGNPIPVLAAPSAIRRSPEHPADRGRGQGLIRSVFGQATIFKPVE